jgi:tRNA-splicing ligase RtcB
MNAHAASPPSVADGARALPRAATVEEAAPPGPDGANGAERGVAPAVAPRIRTLSAGVPPDKALLASLGAIAELPFVEHVLALPDLHQKEHMEVPSSLAITTAGTIVPEFTSVAVNDGMGLVLTDLEARELSPERIERFFTCINSHSGAHLLDANRYSLSAPDLRAAALEGGRAVLCRYGLPRSVLYRMECGGAVPVPGGGEAWSRIVPGWLSSSPMGRSEMGLNFGGNHFLEIQTVDEVMDSRTAERWGLARNQVVIMYHLGPGPFGGTLLHHYSRREKLAGARRPLFFLSKLLLHRRQDLRSAWRLHFRRNGWTAYAADSEEGVSLRQALALATNVGFAYRLATMAAIRDALHDALSPAVGAELLCDISHNGISEEPWGDRMAWVARHNACRLARGGPAIVAGAHDVPSYLGRCAVVGPAELHSYDHGAGHLIEASRRSGRLARDAGLTTRVFMSRGRRGRVRLMTRVPVRVPEPVDRLMTCFANHHVMQPVVRMRPAGTLNN